MLLPASASCGCIAKAFPERHRGNHGPCDVAACCMRRKLQGGFPKEKGPKNRCAPREQLGHVGFLLSASLQGQATLYWESEWPKNILLGSAQHPIKNKQQHLYVYRNSAPGRPPAEQTSDRTRAIARYRHNQGGLSTTPPSPRKITDIGVSWQTDPHSAGFVGRQLDIPEGSLDQVQVSMKHSCCAQHKVLQYSSTVWMVQPFDLDDPSVLKRWWRHFQVEQWQNMAKRTEYLSFGRRIRD